ncbi:hypothetical protein DSO57_1034588 [Entomophthora muscae]|uniref:Uncharacterized protein n=1 Tax=Entomophthora muscae TaxID=34485 RepID=A0ACC2TAT6_9FUNG|nr:hypothetical protein DSO57_1034588 [Entomophthora muscae]
METHQFNYHPKGRYPGDGRFRDSPISNRPYTYRCHWPHNIAWHQDAVNVTQAAAAILTEMMRIQFQPESTPHVAYISQPRHRNYIETAQPYKSISPHLPVETLQAFYQPNSIGLKPK